jgi:ankyrin repeat protein
MQAELPFNTPAETPLDKLTEAMWHGDTKEAQDLLQAINPAELNKHDRYGSTALISATRAGEAALVERLIKKGADTNLKDIANDTALTLAAMNGNEDIVVLLLDKDADPDELGRDGYTPLMAAIENGFSGIAARLLKSGADPEKEAKGKTPFSAAVEMSDIETQRLIDDSIKDAFNRIAKKVAAEAERVRHAYVAEKQRLLIEKVRRRPKLELAP